MALARPLVSERSLNGPEKPRQPLTHPYTVPQLLFWQQCTSDIWVRKTILTGYTLQFRLKPPPFRGVVVTAVKDLVQSSALNVEIQALLRKRAIQLVDPALTDQGFYSKYFLVPKKDGGLRPILDLRLLNKYLRVLSFKMLTHRHIVQSVRQGDWFTTVDLTDAYFHVPICPGHRKYLRFAFQSRVYEFCVLPFGLSLAPRTFSKCMDAILAPLRAQGVRLLNYLDDWLVCAQSKEQLAQHTVMVTDHLQRLGLKVNPDKSRLVPSQQTEFLGLHLDSVSMEATLSTQRVASLERCLSLFRLRETVSMELCQRMLGLMAAASQALPLGLLHQRPLQAWFNAFALHPRRDKHRRLRVSRTCWEALRWWKVPSNIRQGVRLGPIFRREVITTDASNQGWGAVWNGTGTRGVWSGPWRSAHINALELRAVDLALRHFLPVLLGKHVLVRSDNTTVVAYINRQGGLRSPGLHRMVTRLLLWAQPRLASLRAVHLPGRVNYAADLLSRGGPLAGEWRLHPRVVERIWEWFGTAQVDLFASRETTHCPLWFSVKDLDSPLGVDALAHEWPPGLLYAFPPISMLPAFLEKVRVEQATVILIAPRWPRRIWFPSLVQLLHGRPRELPLRADLLSQAQGGLWHPNPKLMQLWAWPLSGSACQP